VQFDSSGKFLLAACKSDTGTDTPRILQFAFASGKLMPNNPGVVMFGADPRHMTFDSGRKHLYVITEAANQLFWFNYDSNAGTVSNPQMISALDAGGRTGAGGHIAFGGARLYVSNRSDNSIGIFSVDAAGRPQKVGWQRMGATDVREFSFDPTGQFMVTANQSSSQVTVFRVDPAAGTLTQVGTPTTVASQATAVTFASR
jgi:6-phosphogluconolactonase (cycloisomerase 2 family)